MKSGLAAGIAALDALAWAPDSLDGSVLFIATPDEEHESRGMTAAVPELVRSRDARGLELLGVLNLDYCLEPAVYLGAVGKLQMGCYVLGTASHVGDPSRGADALSLAAAIMNAVAEGRGLIDTWEAERGVPPVALKLN